MALFIFPLQPRLVFRFELSVDFFNTCVLLQGVIRDTGDLDQLGEGFRYDYMQKQPGDSFSS